MRMENGHVQVLQLSVEQFSQHRSSFLARLLIGSHLIRSTSTNKGWKLTQSSSIALCIRQFLVKISLFTWICNILMFCECEIAVYLSLREIICSPKEFALLRILNCVPAYRPFGLFGHAHRMLPRQPVLRCLRGRISITPLQTGPLVFSGTRIACFPDSRPCGVCGAANRLRPC